MDNPLLQGGRLAFPGSILAVIIQVLDVLVIIEASLEVLYASHRLLIRRALFGRFTHHCRPLYRRRRRLIRVSSSNIGGHINCGGRSGSNGLSLMNGIALEFGRTRIHTL